MAKCLPIDARFIKYSKERCSNEDRYTCPLCRVKEDYLVHYLSQCQGLSTIKEGLFVNNKLILSGVLNSTSPQFTCRVARYMEILLNKKKNNNK